MIGFIPLMIGLVESLFAILQGQSPSILSLVAMLLGFLFCTLKPRFYRISDSARGHYASLEK
ncbi:hypothetical protein C3Z13_02695 [Avibacterium endocarditidis]|uniref:Uncharacterized protein n=1 Tax=Avibacterium endocarditidis TaxID=380674 RepID=A0ABX4ZUY5_9PAST|nr:hypothetical protein C3Z13_02695 [Avibacterium endocarditidis]